VLKEPNSIPGFTSRLMNRWSCSTILLRYLTLRSSVVLVRVWSAIRLSIAGGNHRILIYIYDWRCLVMRRLSLHCGKSVLQLARSFWHSIMLSKVFPSESTARYRYFHSPFTEIYVSSTRHESFVCFR
jgi:hypothetical protein